jgi:hypothetical protein
MLSFHTCTLFSQIREVDALAENTTRAGAPFDKGSVNSRFLADFLRDADDRGHHCHNAGWEYLGAHFAKRLKVKVLRR